MVRRHLNPVRTLGRPVANRGSARTLACYVGGGGIGTHGLTGVEQRLKALMLRGLDGDAAAHADLLREMSGFLRAYFGRRMGASADVEDLVQEVLLAIHLKRQTYDRRQPFTPWAYALARYKMIDHLRRAGARPTVPLDDAGVLFASDDPEEGAIRRDLEVLMADLTPRNRQVMRDVKLRGLSMREAAARAGMSIAAVKVSVHRSLKRLAGKVNDADG